MSPLKVLSRLFEKVAATWVQSFAALLLIGGSINTSTAQAAAIAGIPAALTALVNGIPLVPTDLPFYLDLALRTVRTYVVAFVGLLLAVPVFHLSIGAGKAALVGAIPAALAVVKAGLAANVGNPTSAALLPAKLDR